MLASQEESNTDPDSVDFKARNNCHFLLNVSCSKVVFYTFKLKICKVVDRESHILEECEN